SRRRPMKILFATDGSAGAATAGRPLPALPLPPGTPVTVLRAVSGRGRTPLPALGGGGGSYPAMGQEAGEGHREARPRPQGGARPLRERGLPVTVTVQRHRPVEAILEQAREDGADLIVVGSHGMGAVERFLIGSVSERVARYAHCSVLVARGESARRAIVAVD